MEDNVLDEAILHLEERIAKQEGIKVIDDDFREMVIGFLANLINEVDVAYYNWNVMGLGGEE